MNGKEIFQLAQETSVLATLAVLLGRADNYQEVTGQPVLVKLQLMDQQQTTAAVSMAVIKEPMIARLMQLRSSLEDKGVDTSEMLADIDKQMEEEKKQLK